MNRGKSLIIHKFARSISVYQSIPGTLSANAATTTTMPFRHASKASRLTPA